MYGAIRRGSSEKLVLILLSSIVVLTVCFRSGALLLQSSVLQKKIAVEAEDSRQADPDRLRAQRDE